MNLTRDDYEHVPNVAPTWHLSPVTETGLRNALAKIIYRTADNEPATIANIIHAVRAHDFVEGERLRAERGSQVVAGMVSELARLRTWLERIAPTDTRAERALGGMMPPGE